MPEKDEAAPSVAAENAEGEASATDAAMATSSPVESTSESSAPAEGSAATAPETPDGASGTNAPEPEIETEMSEKISESATAPVATPATPATTPATPATSTPPAVSSPPSSRMVKSIVLTGFGNHEKLKVKQWPLAIAPAAGQVEVSVIACGVNYFDVYVRRGLQKERSPPFVLGMECAGTVTALGEGVDTLKVGDKVLCYQHTGDLYRETVILPASNVIPLPEGISFDHAAALPLNYLSAYFGLLDIGYLRPGQSILIHSCTGGMGYAATQIARTVENVTIFGTAPAAKHEAAKENGVTHVLNPESYEQELLAKCPQGVDIIIETAGCNVSTNLKLLKPLGRFIVVGMNNLVPGHQKLGIVDMLRSFWSVKSVPVPELVNGNRVVAGLNLGKIHEQDPEAFRRALEYVFKLYAERRIAPKIDSEWSFEQVVDASKHLSEQKNIGKVLLKVNVETEKSEL